MKILILNGPNLNLLGKREPQIYGSKNFESYIAELQQDYPYDVVDYKQSNVEGELVNMLHAADDQRYDGIIFNAGGYTHTSVAIGDAVAAISTPVIEVHISNVMRREEFRHVSYISSNAVGVISGFGMKVYNLGLAYFQSL